MPPTYHLLREQSKQLLISGSRLAMFFRYPKLGWPGRIAALCASICRPMGGKSSRIGLWYCWWKKSCTSWYGKYPINLQGFMHVGWCRISSINSMEGDSPKQELFSSFLKKYMCIYVYIHTFFCLIHQHLCSGPATQPALLGPSNHAAGIREARKTKTGRRASNLLQKTGKWKTGWGAFSTSPRLIASLSIYRGFYIHLRWLFDV